MTVNIAKIGHDSQGLPEFQRRDSSSFEFREMTECRQRKSSQETTAYINRKLQQTDNGNQKDDTNNWEIYHSGLGEMNVKMTILLEATEIDSM